MRGAVRDPFQSRSRVDGWCGLVLASAVVFAAIGLAAQERVDVSGTWILEVTTDAGTGTPTLTLKQEGERLSGHYSSSNLGEAELEGTVKGREISFGFTATVQGAAIAVTYTGTVESAGSMKGSVNLAGVAGGTFTGKRQ